MNLLLFSIIFASAIFLSSCKNDHTLFRLVSPDESGIHFNNLINENDSINPLDVTNLYNGGGVGIGDFNNDGLQDIYFTGNLVPDYDNDGDLDMYLVVNVILNSDNPSVFRPKIKKWLSSKYRQVISQRLESAIAVIIMDTNINMSEILFNLTGVRG